MTRTTFIIASTSYIIRKGLLLLLQKMDQVQLLHEVDNIRELNSSINMYTPDVLIVGSDFLPKQNVDTKALFPQCPHIKIVIIDPHTSQKAGYHSQITLNDSPESLLKNIRQLLPTPTPVEESTDVGPISNREKTILKHIAQGMTNKEIADKLFISKHTVVTHRKNITHKLGIKSVAGLTVYAILNNLITVDQVQ